MREDALKRDARFPAFLFLAAVMVASFFILSAGLKSGGAVATALPGAYNGAQVPLGFPIDINTAGPQELQLIPGIGKKLSERIVGLRETSGGFSEVDDLLGVRGMGESRLKGIRDFVTVSGGATSAPAGAKIPEEH
ncbi:MAG: hypothetical protein BMS9Abin23_0507 [Thermodesulfobacteriota bacterium]|nr:MAG: hypothetical protein BMS9Abin23_0507 [Thermodesulfobacteriota bacterium]